MCGMTPAFDSTPPLAPGDALLVVDVQRDFCPGGALPVPDGEAVVPVLNRWLIAAEQAGRPVFASRDWHPPDHCSFAEQGGPWPPHCVRETEGASFHPALRLPRTATVVDKGTARDRDAYSAFEGTGLRGRLRDAGVRRLLVGGLALDICVHATVLAALDHGFAVRLLRDGSRGLDAADVRRRLEEMERLGVEVLEGAP
jgi:nicotinamidase/pyrazinamidase